VVATSVVLAGAEVAGVVVAEVADDSDVVVASGAFVVASP
jgi:hypothetical protein